MNTKTELVNRALAYIGVSRISNIDDTNSKAANTAREHVDAVIDEVLSSHRWNCASKRVTLSKDLDPPNHGYKNSYTLPGDFLRLMEVNGEQVNGSEEFLEIEGNRLVGDFSSARIRYIRRIAVPAFDAPLFDSVACKLASVLAIPLTAKIELQTHALALYNKAVGQARFLDAISTGSRENRPLERLLANSPLLGSRGGRNSITNLRKWPTWQWPQTP